MNANNLFALATAGFALMATFFALDRYQCSRAHRDHYRAKLRGQVTLACAKAEQMVQHRGLTEGQQQQVWRYLAVLEKAHNGLGLGHTERFHRLRQTLIRNNRGVRVVV